MRKVLYVSHNHFAIRPGGAEIYADELYAAVRAEGRFEPFLVARVGPPLSLDTAHAGTRFALAGEDPNQYHFFTHLAEFDILLWTAREKQMYTEDWRNFLRVLDPDVVHFHHTMFLGYDIVRETRSTLPQVPIIYTLHEFMPICHNYGQMVRTGNHEPCYAASPRRCHDCFPAISAQSFLLRERFVKSAFALVDLAISPSQHGRRRYIEWGIPPERILTENYGRIPVTPIPDPPDAGRRKRIGFFGQLTTHKGVDVLLEAMKILQRDNSGVELVVGGANLGQQSAVFRARIAELLEETADTVRFIGSYTQADLPQLLSSIDWLIVPSVWWETGPLVIHEAMMHRRPVICSDIGSMVERVRDGVNGLHFRVRDPNSLAETIRRATGSPELWDELRAQIHPPYSMEEHLQVITGIYERLLAHAEVASAG